MSSIEPLDDLLELHRGGALAAEYPRAQRLVADLPRNALPRAGRILARLDPEEVLRRHPAVPALTVAITGHGTLAELVPAVHAELARCGVLARTAVSDFDAYTFDLADHESALYESDPDLVLCVLDPSVVADELPVPWRPADAERALTQRVRMIEHLATRFEERGRGTLVLNTLPLPSVLTAQLVDHRSRARLGAVWREANARLLGLAERHAVVVVDLDPLVAEGIAVDDPRMRVYARANLSAALLARYAREIGHLARHLTGRTKKALAVDLDGTLWGGVLGDDGVEGIEVAESYRGEAFRAFQRVVRQLGSQGVLLAAVSKNDPEPVREALRDHPRMTVTEDDFVRVIANWRPKHDNLTELAASLNLGVDAFVFADDSAYECGLVRRELPGVAVVQLDDEPALHPGRLLDGGWFDVRTLTAEDRARPARYREDLVRQDFLDSFDSLEGYLRELGVRVRLAALREADVPRVSQLTLRTNQFNLTTRRLQPPEVRALLEDAEAQVLTIHAADRFGDNGLVGAVLTRRDDDAVHIDNFLLSCRVFSRGIEQACLAAVLRRAAERGARAVYGTYRKTAKNGKVSGFYPRHGFTLVEDAGAVTTFRHDLRELPEPPEHVELTASFEGTAW
ncbi:MAG TPA: HAD-IIIC family phosphatase [Thermomonospora sp.]|nr:HAD-IIIC family phosphatase [Thermomonospora sp.]